MKTAKEILRMNAAGWVTELPKEAEQDFLEAMEEYADQQTRERDEQISLLRSENYELSNLCRNIRR